MKKYFIAFIALLVFIMVGKAQTVQYLPLYDDATFARSINMTDGIPPTGFSVGSTSGSLDVSPTGGVSYTIPIALPPGTKGVVPGLSIAYNSQGGNGMMGMGWNFSGVSAITRVNKDLFNDGVVESVKLNSNDIFALDGNKLISLTGTYGSDAATYATKMESFSTITSNGSVNGGPEWFKVTAKNGMTYEYGNTPDSKFTLFTYPGPVAVSTGMWYLNKVYDQYGNYIKYNYTRIDDEIKLSEILYTGNDNAGIVPYNKIVFNYAFRDDKNLVFVYDAFVENKSILTDIVITTENAQLVKKYNFKYGFDNIHSYLREVIETGSDNTQLNSTIFKYGTAPTQEGTVVNFSAFVGEIISKGDFNGDGLTDIVTATKGTVNGKVVFTSFKVYIKNSNNDDFTNTFNEPIAGGFFNVQVNSYLGNSNNILTNDADANGRDDITIVTTSFSTTTQLFTGTVKTYSCTDATGTNFSPKSRQLNVTDNFNTNNNRCNLAPKNSFLAGDFNGDGKSEYIAVLGVCNNLLPPFKAFIFSSDLENMSIANQPKEITFSTIQMNDLLNAADVRVVDFDGDGKSELMTLTPGGHTVYSFATNTSGMISVSQLNDIPNANSVPNSSQPVIIGDFNGDRKTDVLTKNSAGTWYVNYSTGRWFRPWSNIPSYQLTYGDPVVDDFDGDGMSDIAFITIGGIDVTYKVVVNFSKGNSFYSKMMANPTQLILNTGDFNGDGKADLIGVNAIFSFKKDAKNQLLEKVKNGFNVTTSVTYKSMAEGGTFYTKGTTNTYPLNSIQIPLYLASSVTNPDGIGGVSTTNYQYEDAIIHRAGKGFLGFRKFRSSNAIQNIESTTEFEILTPQYVTALKKATTKQLSTNTLLSETTNTNSIQVNGSRYWSKVDATVSNNVLTGATISTTTNYNTDGNITFTGYNVNGEDITNTSYDWWGYTFGIPNGTFTNRIRTGSGPIQKIIYNHYNAQGDVLKRENLDYEEEYTRYVKTFIDNVYSSTGTVTSTTLSAPDLPTKTTLFEYDPKYRYVTKTTNPLGQFATKTYNPKWGNVVTETDIAGLTTTYSYDGFGRLINTLTPQGHNIGVQYRWSYSGTYLPIKCYDIVTTIPGKPSTWDIYDVFGRKTLATTENYGSPGYRWVYTYVVTEYDARGNVAKSMTPVNSTDWGSQEYTTYEYDGLNRLSRTYTGIGTTYFGYSYNAGKTTASVTTPAYQTSSKTTEASGKVVSTTDYGGTLTFDYDSRGNQTAVKLGTTVLSSMTYDFRGQQKSLTDKNAGTSNYNYNAYGELTSQKDASANEYNMTYDILGRLLTRTGPEGITTNEYVSIGNGINQIKKVTSFNGNTQQYVYDNWQRLTIVREVIDGSAYYKTLTYNPYNDVATTTYPSGLVISNTYSPDGYLIKVMSGSQILFDGSDVAGGKMNGFGKWQTYKLGNGITTNTTYNSWGMPTTFQAGAVQNLYLNWNLQTGNLYSRTDYVKGKTEAFTYDNLNRLTSAQVSGLTLKSYVFAANGNITSKPDVGNYIYDPNRINAVTEVNSSPTPSVIPSFQQDIIYTKFLRPEKITEGISGGTYGSGNYELTYTYASDYERRKGVLKVNGSVVNTRLYMGDYEIDTKNGVTREIHYISGGDGMCSIVIKENDGYNYYFPYTDHLGSILTITNISGTVVAEQNFDAWGRKRHVNSWDYAGVQSVPDWLYRGYTGHEHLTEFGLINMNARLYDPVLGRMLSPDNLVGEGGTQAFNRYSYANNNPLSFIDPDGNSAILIGMVIGAFINVGTQLVSNNFSFNNWNWGSFVGAVVAGGVGGALAPALSASHIGGFAGGTITGAATGFAGSLTTGVINNTSNLFGNVLKSTLIGGAIGGAIGALDVVVKNNTGDLQAAETRLWDGRGRIATQREQVPGETPVAVSGTPRMGIRRNGVSSYTPTDANGRPLPIQSGFRAITTKSMDINEGFEGNLNITGLANPQPGETFTITVDGRNVFSTTQQRVSLNFNIPSSSQRITWGVTGNAAQIPGGLQYRNSFIQLTGAHRSWSGFLFFR